MPTKTPKCPYCAGDHYGIDCDQFEPGDVGVDPDDMFEDFHPSRYDEQVRYIDNIING